MHPKEAKYDKILFAGSSLSPSGISILASTKAPPIRAKSSKPLVQGSGLCGCAMSLGSCRNRTYKKRAQPKSVADSRASFSVVMQTATAINAPPVSTAPNCDPGSQGGPGT